MNEFAIKHTFFSRDVCLQHKIAPVAIKWNKNRRSPHYAVLEIQYKKLAGRNNQKKTQKKVENIRVQ